MNQKRMVLTLAAVGLVLLAATVAIGYAARPPVHGRIELSATEFDFGEVPDTQPVSQVFRVRNVGKGPLQITGVSTSCGCTMARLSSSVIPPGQRADLVVTFDPDYHPTQGQVVRLVWFATNDPVQPWAEVRILAETEQS